MANLHGCHLRSAPSKAPAALAWKDLLVFERSVEPVSLQAGSEGAMLSRSPFGVLGGVLNGLPFTSMTLATGGAKSVPLNTAAVSTLTCCLGPVCPCIACTSFSNCSTVHTGARARSFSGSSENRFV